jgi:hypothetical protein
MLVKQQPLFLTIFTYTQGALKVHEGVQTWCTPRCKHGANMVSALELIQVAVVGGLAALAGSSIVWLTLGPYVVKKHGVKQLQTGFQKAIDNPGGPESKMIGSLCQQGVAYALNSLPELIPENPNEPAHPVFNSILRRIEDHAGKAMFAAFGRIMNNMKKAGIDVQGGNVAINPLGILGNLGGSGNIVDMLPQLAQLGGQIQQAGGTGVTPASQLPPPHFSRGGNSGGKNWP